MSTQKGLLYIYLGTGIDVPFSTTAKEQLSATHPQYSLHDIDLGADTLTWHYTHRWLEEQEEILVFIEGESLEVDEPQLAKKTVAQLIKYRSKISLHYLGDALNSPYCGAFRALLLRKV